MKHNKNISQLGPISDAIGKLAKEKRKEQSLFHRDQNALESPINDPLEPPSEQHPNANPINQIKPTVPRN